MNNFEEYEKVVNSRTCNPQKSITKPASRTLYSYTQDSNPTKKNLYKNFQQKNSHFYIKQLFSDAKIFLEN